MSLKDKTIIGVVWNAVELFGGNIIGAVITIILARILMPEDFGIIGLLVLFTEFSRVILNSGFSQALIRKKDAGQEDYTAVFYFNIICGICLYLILYFISPLISRFYEFPELTGIARTIFLIIPIYSFGIVQNAIIVKEVNFKTLAKRTLIARVIAGIIALILAYQNFGVWALVFQLVIASVLGVILIWKYSRWMPSLSLNMGPVRSMFKYSRNLLLSGIIDSITTNIQTLLIGKFYSKSALGFYTQANQLSRIPSTTMTTIIKKVTFPTLSVIQDDVEKLKQAYKRIIRIAVAIIFPVMLGLFAIGHNLILFLMGEKWMESIPYFMLMCLMGAMYPLYLINQNIFLVNGNSKLYLKISIAQRIITLSAILITIPVSVLALVIGQVCAMLINTLIMMLYSGREIGYFMKEQVKDLSSIVLASILMCISVVVFGNEAAIANPLIMLISQIALGITVFILLAYTLKLSVIKDFREIVARLKALSGYS